MKPRYLSLSVSCARFGLFLCFGFASCSTHPTQTSSPETEKILFARETRTPASIGDQVRALDKSKPTVCSITINSTDEKELFQKKMGTDRFNFIELIDPQDNSRDWFLNACQSGVQCDVLLISGHFAGRFFGSSDQVLPLQKLEKYACHSSCDGILKNPKEVFLFGCNTLAGKNKDSRTQEEYTRILIEKYYYPRDVAEQVSAFRYSPIGQTNEARMRRAFKGAVKLYGFDSSAPYGRRIAPLLESYFKNTGDYTKHLISLDQRTPNTRLRSALTKTSFVESSGWGDVSRSPTCFLDDQNVQTTAKIQWIHDTLSDKEKALQHALSIQEYLKLADAKEVVWTQQQKKLLDQIGQMTETKQALAKLLNPNIKGMLYVQTGLASLMRQVGWWSHQDYRNWVTAALQIDIGQDISPAQQDQICRLRPSLDILAEDLPSDSLTWSLTLLNTLNCLQPTEPAVTAGLLHVLTSHPDFQFQIVALYALSSAVKLNTRLQARLLDIFEATPHERIVDTIRTYLSQVENPDESLILRVIDLIRRPDFGYKAMRATEIIEGIAPTQHEIVWSLVDILKSDTSGIHRFIRSRVANALKAIRPNDREFFNTLFDIIERNSDLNIRYPVSDILSSGSLDDEMQTRAITILRTHPEKTARVAAVSSLTGSFPLSEKIKGQLREALREEKEEIVLEWLQDVLDGKKLR